GTRHHLRDIARGGGADGPHVGAKVGGRAPAQAQYGALTRAGDFEVALGVARVVGRHQILTPVLDPFDRPAEKAGRERDQEILRVELPARAEAAADVVLDQADAALVEP